MKRTIRLTESDIHRIVRESVKRVLREDIESQPQRHWSEIRCDHNNGEGFWCVDAWMTDDDNEEGKVIAVIDETSKNVYYIDPMARSDYYAQEVIQDTLNKI